MSETLLLMKRHASLCILALHFFQTFNCIHMLLLNIIKLRLDIRSIVRPFLHLVTVRLIQSLMFCRPFLLKFHRHDRLDIINRPFGCLLSLFQFLLGGRVSFFTGAQIFQNRLQTLLQVLFDFSCLILRFDPTEFLLPQVRFTCHAFVPFVFQDLHVVHEWIIRETISKKHRRKNRRVQSRGFRWTIAFVFGRWGCFISFLLCESFKRR